MAFMVEDGAGLEDATSLCDVAHADTYFEDRNNSVWSGLTDEQKQTCLIKGTDYLCGHYEFKGKRLNARQALCFPRKELYDPDGNPVTDIPICIMNAVAELAVRSVSKDLLPDPAFDDGGRKIKSLRESVASLRRDIEYAGPGELMDESMYPAVDAVICPWLLMNSKNLKNGVYLTGPDVTGVCLPEMKTVESNPYRYSGPFDQTNFLKS